MEHLWLVEKRFFHACQKPVAVLEKIIATHTYPPMTIQKN